MIQNIKNLSHLINKKSKIALIPIAFLVVTIIIYLTYINEFSNLDTQDFNSLKLDPSTGLYFFYLLQDSGYMIYLFLLIMAIIPNLISDEFLSFQNNHCDFFLISRLKHRHYLRDSILTNYILTFIFILCIQLYILIIIHFFCFPLTQIHQITEPLQYANILGYNSIVNLILYILLSSLGCGIFSTFLYSLQYVIKNVYVYKACGIILGILLYVAPTLLSGGMVTQFHNYFFARLFYFFNVVNLVSPGIIVNGFLDDGALIFFIGSFLIYGIASCIFFMIKERYEYG